MCEPADALDVLRSIPFKVRSLESVVESGSFAKAIVGCVADSVRKDIECAMKQIEDERKGADAK